MRLSTVVTASMTSAAFGLTGVIASPATAVPADEETTTTQTSAPEGGDELPSQITDEERELRTKALDAVLQGKATVSNRGGSKVTKLPNGQYVELGRETTDNVFVVLTEFGDQVHPTYGGAPGPLHNQIEQPDRSVNNTTIWQPSYETSHYQDLYFGEGPNSVASYFERQSSGRYSIQGSVADWVKLPYNEARYGSNINQRETYWSWITDSVQAWYDEQLAAGRSRADVIAELKANDVWDRYDHDKDGNFNEADGYIDHFQIVHAGEGEETGGGAQGADAIWSHKWYVNGDKIGSTGPENNKLGGVQIGDTGIWVGNYTAQPENGGLGVFAHEYGHDLGLPDEYDTSYRGESSAGFWTLMASGSYMSDGTNDIGSRPNDLNAWDKLQLGWLNYKLVDAATHSETQLGLAEFNTKKAQALVVRLPEKQVDGKSYGHYYIAENRQYVSYDDTLATGPYNFGFTNTRPDWVEHFPYQNGLLLSYWDTSQRDNRVGVHPGQGRILPIDVNATPETWSDGTAMRTRIQVYDAPLSFDSTDGITVHKNGVPTAIQSKPGVQVFDDRNGTYWTAAKPDAGVKVPDTNTQIVLKDEANGGKFVSVVVRPAS